MTRRATDAGTSVASETSDGPIVVLESTFVPSGEIARREHPIERESIPPGSEPEHWPVLTVGGDGRLLLDTDDLRAVWTGSGPWEGDRA